MLSARADPEGRGLLVDSASLPFRAGIADGASNGIVLIALAANAVIPGGRVGVFEVRHEAARAAVQRVDDHLAIDRPGDLDAAVAKVGRDGRDSPGGGLTDVPRLGEKVREQATV